MLLVLIGAITLLDVVWRSPVTGQPGLNDALLPC